MASDEIDWIEPMEALRILTRALWPAAPDLADRVTKFGYNWPKSIVDGGIATAEEFNAAKRAKNLFHEKQRGGAIRMLGVFNGEGLHQPIEPSSRYLDISKRHLDCSIPGYGKRVYLDVLVSRQDVEALVHPDGKVRRKRRGPPLLYDWDEGKQFLAREYKSHGDPRKSENQTEGWRSISDAAKAVVVHLERGGKEGPDLSTARRRVSDWLDEFEKCETEQSARN